MTTLGEAYIAVKADMRPFTRDLKKEVEKVIKDAENVVRKGLSESLTKGAHEAGSKASDEFGDEFDKKTKKRYAKKEKQPWMVSIAAALAGALDDGISALPMQVKAAIVGGILVALPIVSGALSTAVAAALAVSIAGVGVLLAFQFDQVRDKAIETFGGLRVFLADLARPFIEETLRGLDRLTFAFNDWAPKLRRIFAIGADFVGPLEKGVLGAFDKIIAVTDKMAPKLLPFVDEFSSGIEILGEALADFIELLVSTGDDGRVAFRDLIHLTADFVVNLGYLIKALTTVYGWVRNIAESVPFLSSLLGRWFFESDRAVESTGQYGNELDNLNYQIDNNVVATEAQIQAQKKLVQAMDDTYDAAFKLIDAQIDYEEAVDRLTEALDQNGRTFNVHTKEGRENLRAFEAALKAIHDQVMGLLAEGKITSEQAKQMQDELTAALYKQAGAAGENATALHAMFDEAIKFGDIPVGNQGWLDQIQAKAKAAAEALAQARIQAEYLNSAGLPRSGTRIFSEYAEGGIVNGPTPAIIGEAGPEVVIPLSKPGRAAQLAQQSGLASMLGAGNTAPTVYVFLGNDQLESYMVKVVDRNNRAMGTAMAYGARGL